ncbi:hypothetical protein JQ557_31845 [Bradyrhizobium sp. U87765 SZCCT0131]|nr:hypothetical protein [Bradyrhizobium sp. U87765 SZCCT0131]MBR1265289.1 hypothetical protein [Bradyrhizobium sp. U87765 SZCCT0134]MBR1302932.1 hypothetical protein [Bradyrhizobium sp. U87765 SZCCT0110]MBR1323630.1 hypothetical protein [Bradyrhizobium sp. U87765 SZCCT0109]MBR1346861.1 hypothetical protein [Bradyrhizobium sp. U87765 SZCCT0048]
MFPTGAALVLAASLGGCASGDFGRTRDSALNDDMHRWVGAEATSSIGRRPSDFQLTDYERTLRDQAYAFIEPPHSRPYWKGVFGDYDPIPAPWHRKARFDPTIYGRQLIDEPHRSHASRYAQLIEDVRNDLTRLDPFFTTSARVADFDQKRGASLRYIGNLEPRERADALARMKENALIVQWVGICLQQRIASYRWALERLVIHAPDGLAAEADRLITELAARAGAGIGATPVVGQVLTVKG